MVHNLRQVCIRPTIHLRSVRTCLTDLQRRGMVRDRRRKGDDSSLARSIKRIPASRGFCPGRRGTYGETTADHLAPLARSCSGSIGFHPVERAALIGRRGECTRSVAPCFRETRVHPSSWRKSSRQSCCQGGCYGCRRGMVDGNGGRGNDTCLRGFGANLDCGSDHTPG